MIRYAEDYNAGDVFELGTYDVTREEIIEFSQFFSQLKSDGRP